MAVTTGGGSPPPSSPPPLPRVLVVDDDRVMREVLVDILRDSGFTVAAAESGESALEQLREEPFDLLITDVRMPGLDGLAVLEQAQQIAPDTDVIMMTGYASVDVAVDCMKRGATDFITKPFNVDHILMIATRAMEAQTLRLKAAQRDYFEELALTDGLTNIYNRRYFTQLLETEIARSTRRGHEFILLMMDLDDFKEFNDANGHPQGDEALKMIARILDHSSRASDVVARYGGEEFTVIMPEMTCDEGRLAAERLRLNAESTRIPGEENLPRGQLTISIGLAAFPSDANAAAALIECADRALYAAKQGGKNRVTTWPDVPAESGEPLQSSAN